MPWSDNSDSGKPAQKPGPKPGPWGAPPPAGGRGEEPANQDRPRGEGPRRPGAPQPPEDLMALLRRLRRRVETEFGAFGPGLGPRIVPAIVLAVAGIWLLSGFYDVQANQQGVVTTFGAYSRSAGPGWHYHLPMPIERVEQIPVTTVDRKSVV